MMPAASVQQGGRHPSGGGHPAGAGGHQAGAGGHHGSQVLSGAPASFVNKPARGWLHPDHLFAKVCYFQFVCC